MGDRYDVVAGGAGYTTSAKAGLVVGEVAGKSLAVRWKGEVLGSTERSGGTAQERNQVSVLI